MDPPEYRYMFPKIHELEGVKDIKCQKILQTIKNDLSCGYIVKLL